MQRRWLNGVYDRVIDEWGIYCTRWEGWKDGSDLDIEYRGRAKRFVEFPKGKEDEPGVYVILYYPSARGQPYVLYVGGAGSDVLGRANRSLKRYSEHIDSDAKFGGATCAVRTAADAWDYEYRLIRYYCPAWNIRFAHQGR